MHLCNRAEHAIRTFKGPFLSILTGVDQSFPPYLWDLLLPQAEITLNLLRQLTLNPWILAWESFHGPFDFNKAPLAPVGCRVLIHAKPITRQSWDFTERTASTLGWHLTHIAVSNWSRATPRAKSSPTQSCFVMPNAPYLLPCPTTKSSTAFKLCLVPSLMHRPLHPFPRSRPSPIYVIYSSCGIFLVRLHQARAASCPPDIQGCPFRSLQGGPQPLPPR
jgi:hypothetical protein